MDNKLNFLKMISELTKKNLEYKEEIEQLKKENSHLRSNLKKAAINNSIQIDGQSSLEDVLDTENRSNEHLKPEDKISLFKNVFRGREDVYARRWVGKDGRTGYSPAVKGGYFFAERKKDEKLEYLPFTTKVVEEHLIGQQIVGVYPMLSDETCWFIVADFDKEDFQRDAVAFQKTCLKFEIPAYIERSRSCNGAHVWIFFQEPVPAAMARKLGFSMLTRTMNRRHQLELSSYDRFFPNQDTLPKGGFGNLIALPLQKQVRPRGGSVFVNRAFEPYKDQWSFLSSIERISFEQVKDFVIKAEAEGAIVGIRLPMADADLDDPWTLPPSRKRVKPLEGPFPSTVRIVLSNQIFVEKERLPSQLLVRLKRIAAFQNPEFFRHQAMRLSVYNKPRIISCSEDFGKFFAIPRGCMDELFELLKSCNIKPQTEDEYCEGKFLDVEFDGVLRDRQVDAVKNLLKFQIGTLSAGTAFGKTVVAANLIAKRKRNTLVLVHRRQLMDQWQERLSLFLSIPKKSIGLVGGGRKKPTSNIDIAMIQSLVKKGVVTDLVERYGHVIVDECHHVSAFSFESVLKEVKARYILGLTATPKRKDGHHPIVVMQCGPIRYRVSDRDQAKVRSFDHVVIKRKTAFTMKTCDEAHKINDVYASLVEDEDRNQLIVDDVISAVEEGRTSLLLTERTVHLEYFQRKLSETDYKVIVLRGGMGKRQRKAVASELEKENDCKQVVIATGKYVGEGFDYSRLDTLFLAMPVSWTGTLQQYVGRLHRLHDQKKVVQVYDYVDDVPMLQRMFKRRLKGYELIGYRIDDPTKKFLF